MKPVSVGKALVMAIVIVVAVILIVGVLFGAVFPLERAWLLIVSLSVFMGMVKPPIKTSVVQFICGGFYGMIVGHFFSIFVPVLIVGAILLVTCKISGKLKIVMNDFALVFITIYTISGVANAGFILQDIIIFAVFCVVLFIAASVIGRKGTEKQSHLEEGKISKVPLYEEATEKNYYKYYELDVASITDEERAAFRNGQGTKEEALSIHDRAKLQQPSERLPAKTGWYPLKEGGALIASNVPLPGLTADMLNWWGPWHSLDPLRYAIWDPEDHYDVQVDEVGRRRALDPAIPLHKKLWGATHTVREATGGEPDVITMHFADPGEMGYDREIVGTEKCPGMICGNTKMGEKGIPVFMTEVMHYVGDELEIQLRFWVGYEVQGDKAKYRLPKFIKIPVGKIAPGLIEHNFKEYRQLSKFLPELYEQEKYNW